MDRERLKIENEIARERKERENELRQMREQNERERKERENEKRQMREQLERERMENADLRDKLSRASLVPQVETYHVFIHSSPSSSSSSFHSLCVIRSILLDFWSFKVKTGRVDVTNARIS